MTRRRTRPGLSLVELIIVLMIAAIAAALMLPLLGHTDASKLRAAARLLQADLAYAQNEAIVHGDDPRVVVFEATGGHYHIAAASQPALPLAHPVGGGAYVVEYGTGLAAELTGVTISHLSVDGDERLQFGMLGQLDQAVPATITLSAAALSVTLAVDAQTGETTVGPIQ